MAARTASVTGNWSNTATWGGSAAPVAGDSVTVNTGITVTVDVDSSAGTAPDNETVFDFLINGTGQVVISATKTLTLTTNLDINSGGVITVNGTLLTAPLD